LTEQRVLDQARPSTGSAESTVMERLDEEELQRILEMLSPAQREVLLLRFVAGFGIKEIAGIIGKKPGAVQALQRRAFRQLEKILR
jgi:RNA polymerase sigma-70 factor (ECF subfamily)